MDNAQSSSQRGRVTDMSEEQLEAAVLKVTNYLLHETKSKRKLRKDDVVTNALNKSSRQYGTIMKHVKENLNNVFGLQITKLPNQDDSFIMINRHRIRFNELAQKLSSSDAEKQDELILTIVLGSIFMNRGQMFESHVMAILETIGMFNNKFYSSDDVKRKDYVIKLVNNEFVRQMYLEAASVPRPDQPQNPPLPESENKITVLKWGFRALLEVEIDQLVEYLIKVHDGKKPSGFPFSYYNELKATQAKLWAQND